MTTPLIFRDLLGLLPPHARLLVAVATPLEASALPAPALPAGAGGPWSTLAIADRVDLLVTGVGKAPAAAGVASVLSAGRHGGVLNVGIAGSLPSEAPLPLLSVVVASSHVFGDEGVALPPDHPAGDFQSLDAMGFGPVGTSADAVPCDDGFAELLRTSVSGAIFAPIATVSTCSGTNRLARAVADRTRARAECMEGAAVALAARNLGCRYGEMRTISNTTGDRAAQVWDVRGALARLTAALSAAC